jgi:16S rRNA (guanine527-N7)-methyltransferase
MSMVVEGSDDLARISILTDPRVSRETAERLSAYVKILNDWQRRINLVSAPTLEAVWSRHILDSLQLVFLCPGPKAWVDLGSGAGLPGIIIACHCVQTGGHVHLVESNGKKASFLRHVGMTLKLPITVHADRIESVIPRLPNIDIVTARALAELDQLLTLSSLLLKTGAIGVFPKGRDHARELTRAREHWHFTCVSHESVTDSQSRILVVSDLA